MPSFMALLFGWCSVGKLAWYRLPGPEEYANRPPDGKSLVSEALPFLSDPRVNHQLHQMIQNHRHHADAAIDRDLQADHQRFLAARETDCDLTAAIHSQ